MIRLLVTCVVLLIPIGLMDLFYQYKALSVQERVLTAVTGGNNFIYIMADTRGNGEGPFPVVTGGTGTVQDATWFISPLDVKGDATNPRYWTSDTKPRGTHRVLYPDTNMAGERLELGAWRIEWRVKGIGYREELLLWHCGDHVMQQVRVLRREKVIFERGKLC